MKESHLSEGTFQAYLDDQLSASERQQVEAHLSVCARCTEDLQAWRGLMTETQHQLDVLSAEVKPLALLQARAHYQAYASQKEMETKGMKQNIFTRYRTLWTAATLVLILAVALAFPPVRAIANNFLGLFRVQEVSVFEVSDALPEQLSQSSQMELLFSESMQFEQYSEEQVVSSAAEASALAGFAVRQPQGADGDLKFQVTPSGKVQFVVELERLHAVLDEMGRSDLRLPQSVDGAVVSAEIQPGVSISFGPCVEVVGDPDDPDSVYYEDCTSLMQIPSPVVEAPAGLDIQQIGEVYMQFLGMSPEDARRFSEQVDWANTLVVPIPMNALDYQQVAVDGVTGTLLKPAGPEMQQEYLLFWVKDGLVYALSGEGGLAEALAIVDSLE
ncbi:MAG: zf-HC2 domain-containing protein [Anaerolineales bacterium]|nr:zf-HC2 domain-containing protein [Anaerolineales bacterium]